MRCLVAVSLVLGVVSASPALAKPSPEVKAITAAIDDQFAGFRQPVRDTSLYATNAMIAMTGGTATPQVNKLSDAEGKWTIFGPSKIGKHKVRDLKIVVSKDGDSAWASFVVKVTVDGLDASGSIDYRVTELFTKSSGAWQVQAGGWSKGVAAAPLAKAAKAGTLPALDTVFSSNIGDREVLGAMKSLVTSGLDATATKRADVVGIGPAPGEVVVSGKKLAAKMKKEWNDKLAIDGSTWAVTTGTTASATVNVKLTRGDATIPARMFAVFEKDGNAWSPVLVHLAVATP